MRYLTASQLAPMWNLSQRRVQILCANGRINGAFKIGEIWAIPYDAKKQKIKEQKKIKALDEYGRTSIDVSLLGEGIYYFDFSNK